MNGCAPCLPNCERRRHDYLPYPEWSDMASAPEQPLKPISRGGQHTVPLILVVDDSPMDRHLASSLLQESLGAQIVTASHGGEALEALLTQQPALVLTDLQMPE